MRWFALIVCHFIITSLFHGNTIVYVLFRVLFTVPYLLYIIMCLLKQIGQILNLISLSNTMYTKWTVCMYLILKFYNIPHLCNSILVQTYFIGYFALYKKSCFWFLFHLKLQLVDDWWHCCFEICDIFSCTFILLNWKPSTIFFFFINMWYIM